MAEIERMTITLPADMAAVVKSAVKGGDYASTSEVVREARPRLTSPKSGPTWQPDHPRRLRPGSSKKSRRLSTRYGASRSRHLRAIGWLPGCV